MAVLRGNDIIETQLSVYLLVVISSVLMHTVDFVNYMHYLAHMALDSLLRSNISILYKGELSSAKNCSVNIASMVPDWLSETIKDQT